MRRWAGAPVQAPPLGEGRPDPLLGTEPGDAVLPGTETPSGQPVGDEPVAECGVVVVDNHSKKVNAATSQPSADA